jgi:hypothetical protein
MQLQRFILREATIATVVDESGKRVALLIPTAAEITPADAVPHAPTKDCAKQINVVWEGRFVKMFLIDLQHRGERVRTED